MRGWGSAIKVCVIVLGLIFCADMAQAGIEDLLYEKGLITKEEWLKQKADEEKRRNYSTTVGD